MTQSTIEISPIGIIHSPFKNPEGTPIQPRAAKGARGKVKIQPQFCEGLRDLDGFERIWLVYWFHRSHSFKLRTVPFRDSEPRGIFASRAPARPNGIGISAVKLIGISGDTLTIADVDIIDGTPLLDIKPYVPEFDAFKVSRCGWLDRDTSGRTTADRRFSKNAGPNSD
jgi:tRNA-Thr(GGU) m(6)t(6)A37 methyltransferase TsaA